MVRKKIKVSVLSCILAAATTMSGPGISVMAAEADVQTAQETTVETTETDEIDEISEADTEKEEEPAEEISEEEEEKEDAETPSEIKEGTEEASEEAPAAEAEEEIMEIEETIPLSSEEGMLEDGGSVSFPDAKDNNDELFAGFVNREMSNGMQPMMASNYGLTVFKDDPYDLALYKALREKIIDVAHNGGSTVFTFPDENLTSELLTMDVSVDAEAENWSQQMQIGVRNEFNKRFNAKKVMEVLTIDCPYEMYWFNKTANGAMSWTYRFTYKRNYDSDWKVTSYTATRYTSVTFSMYTEDAYQENGDAHTVTSDVSKIQTAIDNAKAIVEKNRNLSDFEKLQAYKDAICDLTEYNFDAISSSYTEGYRDPWQLIYVFDGDPSTKVVCEGYSKAFQYLCELSEFTEGTVSHIVTGKMNGGAHMWNLVEYRNSHYLVDVTNSDDGMSGQDGGLFMITDTGDATGFNVTASGSNIRYNYESSMRSIYPDELLTLSYVPTYNVSGNVSPSAAGTVTVRADTYGDGSVQKGETVTMEAIANEGYVFSHWDEDGENIGTEPVLTFAIEGDRNITAVFEKVQEEHTYEILKGTDGSLGYYIDSVKQYGTGMVKVEDKLYYGRSNGTLAANCQWYVPENLTNGLTTAGNHAFSPEGELIPLSGPVRYNSGEIAFFINDVRQYGIGVVGYGTNLYYVRGNGQVVHDCTWYVPEELTNNMTFAGNHDFNENGVMILKNGIYEEKDGSLGYYEGGKKIYGAGMVRVGDHFYYVRGNGQVVRGCTWYVPENLTNNMTTKGNHEFDEYGCMIIKNGIYEEKDGTLGYYVNDKKQYGAGVIDIGTKLYYVRSNGNVARDCQWYVPEEMTNSFVRRGTYFFDKDGAMIFEKDGLVEEKNGTLGLYEHGVKKYGAGIVEYDGDLYYVRSNGVVVQDMDWYIPDSATNDLTTKGTHSFGKDGKMVVKDQVIEEEDGSLGYYIDGVKQYGNGLIYYRKALCFVNEDGTLARNVTMNIKPHTITSPESGVSHTSEETVRVTFDESGRYYKKDSIN